MKKGLYGKHPFDWVLNGLLRRFGGPATATVIGRHNTGISTGRLSHIWRVKLQVQPADGEAFEAITEDMGGGSEPGEQVPVRYDPLTRSDDRPGATGDHHDLFYVQRQGIHQPGAMPPDVQKAYAKWRQEQNLPDDLLEFYEAELRLTEAENRGESPLPAAKTAPAGHRLELLPSTCPNCGGQLHGDNVKWTGAQSADCPYCGSNLPMRTESGAAAPR